MSDSPRRSAGGGESGEVVLCAELLVRAYAAGYFPMAEGRGSERIFWLSPDPRGVLPVEGFHCPASVERKIRRGWFEIRWDEHFEEVMRGCAEERKTEQETWINEELIGLFVELHELGLAHCVEAWREGRLVGGLYGMALGGVFFAESMFHRAAWGGTDASKVCLAKMVERLGGSGFELMDVQFCSELLCRFGAVEISRDEYLGRLTAAVRKGVRW